MKEFLGEASNAQACTPMAHDGACRSQLRSGAYRMEIRSELGDADVQETGVSVGEDTQLVVVAHGNERRRDVLLPRPAANGIPDLSAGLGEEQTHWLSAQFLSTPWRAAPPGKATMKSVCVARDFRILGLFSQKAGSSSQNAVLSCLSAQDQMLVGGLTIHSTSAGKAPVLIILCGTEDM